MSFLNFGSLNLDVVYQVPRIATTGETVAAKSVDVFPGGKGLNQSIALARAGAEVFHAGLVGEDGGILEEALRESGVDIRYLNRTKTRTGNAVIQVDETGRNSIVLFGGANRENSLEYIEETLSHFHEGDCLVLQNEVNLLDELIDRAYEKGMSIALNPSPYNGLLDRCRLDKVDLFLLNEVECRQMTGEKTPEEGLDALCESYPRAEFVLTLGEEGAFFGATRQSVFCPALPVEAIDTTGAGDTFTGYFLAAYWGKGLSAERSLQTATVGAALSVTRKGAAGAIPTREEVLTAYRQWI